MDITEGFLALAAGAIQGATELLPVSSSGHLLLFADVTSYDITLMSAAVLHLGTLGALLIIMKDSLSLYFEKKTLINILISILPAGIIGFVFNDVIESELGTPAIIIFSLVMWGIALIVTDRIAEDHKPADLTKITPKQAGLVGLLQPLSFISGTSRSGVTTIAGVLGGLDRDTALRFSFLSGIPLLAASGLYSVIDLRFSETLASNDWELIAIATVAAFFVGLGAAYIMKKYINRSILTLCGVYRIAVGVILIFSIGILNL